MDLLTLPGLDLPHSLRLRGSNAEGFVPPSRQSLRIPRPSMGRTESFRTALGRAPLGLAQMKLSRERIGGQLEGPRRAQGLLRGFVIRGQDGGKVAAASHS